MPRAERTAPRQIRTQTRLTRGLPAPVSRAVAAAVARAVLGAVVGAATAVTILPAVLAAQERAEWDPFVEVYVPHTPVLAFPADGQLRAAYELHITNLTNSAIDLRSVEVWAAPATALRAEGRQGTPVGGGAPSDGQPLLRLEDTRLRSALLRPGLGDNPEEPQRVGPGLRAVVWIWLDLHGVARGKLELEHALTVRRVDANADSAQATAPVPASESIEERVLRIAPVRLETLVPVVLGPPLRGGPWVVGNGPSNFTHHRRALIPMDGRVRIAQRFAIDYALLNDDGRPWRGDELDNASYHGYGAELLAVADGTVVDVKDGLPENVPGLTSRAIPITMATVAGNYVTLKIGEGHYAFYAHLQPGSLRVRLGDRVRRGDVLGLLGNSGNSTAPHLHFHVSDGTSPLGSEGLPYVIDAFDVLGRGVFWNRARATDPVRHEKELPLANMVIQFPDLPEPER